jgi:hypothetical protein
MKLRIRLKWYPYETFRLFQLGLFETYGKGEPIYLFSVCIAKLFFEVSLEEK